MGPPAPLGGTDWVEGGILTPLPPRTLEMLAGDPVLSGDPEPDKTPTATLVRDGTKGTGRRGPWRRGSEEGGAPALLVPECCLPPPQTSETNRWSGPSPEDPAPLTGRGALRPSEVGEGQKGVLPSSTAYSMHQGHGSAHNRSEPLYSGSPQSEWRISVKQPGQMKTRGCLGKP